MSYVVGGQAPSAAVSPRSAPRQMELLLKVLTTDRSSGLGAGTILAIRNGYDRGSARWNALNTLYEAAKIVDLPQRRRYDNPMAGTGLATAVQRHRGTKRDLTAAEAAFLLSLPADPKDISIEDARIVADMSGAIDVTSPDRAILDRVYKPLKAHHDGVEKVTHLEDDVKATFVHPIADTEEVRQAKRTLMKGVAEAMAADSKATAQHAVTTSPELQGRIEVLTVDDCMGRVERTVASTLEQRNTERYDRYATAKGQLEQAVAESGQPSEILAQLDKTPPPAA